jgi:hypothetical protein
LCRLNDKSGKQTEELGSYDGVIVGGEENARKGVKKAVQSEHSNVNRL